MATAKLTKTAVEAAPVSGADSYLWDSVLPRFGLRVTPAGARIYLVQYRAKPAPGEKAKTRRITIGQHGKPWTVEKARDEAKTLLACVDLGRDPFADREDERDARRRAAEATAQQSIEAEIRQRDNFETVAERFAAQCKANRSGEETARLIRFDAIPAWKGRHISEVRRSDVADLMDAISKRSPAVARAAFSALTALFAWCERRELIPASPCAGADAPPRPDARDRVLTDDELRSVWAGADRLGFPFGPVVKLLMLTGQRRGEVAGMVWSELDLDKATWRIPKERAKNGKAHEVDLSPQALAVIDELETGGTYLFPARGKGAVVGFSATKRKLDGLVEDARREEAAKAGKPAPEPLADWRLHDLRRSAATGMAGMNFPPHVVERVLNHISGTQSGLVGVYQRHEYRAERKAALVAWGAHVEAVVTGIAPAPNVHQLRA